ncbi:hypothetical protein [Paenibacillus cremeus]|uniref:hypothetical protein n=1 Tax=Paenibacillus cremeus TaxID=2163881 RepID=UPI0016443C57|nr:hypothetical protein [Paenibacillus cremeus]
MWGFVNRLGVVPGQLYLLSAAVEMGLLLLDLSGDNPISKAALKLYSRHIALHLPGG